MKEWVTSRGIVCCTKEIELLKWIHPDGRLEWKLDICAYGQWWCESFDRKLDAYRMLRDRWGVSWAFWRELCQEARAVGENEECWNAMGSNGLDVRPVADCPTWDPVRRA